LDVNFKDRSAKVLVVEGSGATRTLISEVVKKQGFSNVTGVPTIKDALGVMEADAVGWVICSVFADQSENAIHLLKIVTEIPQLRYTRVSFLLDEEEQKVLVYSFQLGLLSYHKKPFTKDSLNNEFEGLIKTYESTNYNATLTAAVYLRQYLTDEKMDKDLINFEKSLVNLYPSDYDLLFNLIPPMSRLDRKDDATAILGQVLAMDPEKKVRVDKLRNDYLDGVEIGQDGEGGEKYNFLGLDNVVVIEPDETVSNYIMEVLADVGVTDVQVFTDGEEAASHIAESPNPGAILMEWRVPSLPGPLLVQRLKAEGGEVCPIMVISSLLQADDIPLVKEMGVANCLEKPIDKTLFLRKLIWTIQQDRNPSEQATMERKIRDFLKAGKTEDALSIKSSFMGDSKISEGAKAAIEAEFSYYEGRYEASKAHGIEAIKLCGDSLFMLNLLGKSLMQLREFDVALKCFKKAQQLSPQNIERLCSISEVHSEMGDHKEAEKTLEEANKIDADNKGVAETAAKLAVNSGDSSRAKVILSKLDSIGNVISFMNNSAVALAKCNMVDEGIEQYRKTLKSIPDDQEGTKAIVTYNLALAHARSDELEEACLHLDRIKKVDSRVKDKSLALLRRIKKAMEAGTTLTFAKGTSKQGPEQEKQEEEKAKAKGKSATSTLPEVDYEAMAAVECRPGEHACFMLFFPEEVAGEITKLSADPPRFRIRFAIEKEESLPSAS